MPLEDSSHQLRESIREIQSRVSREHGLAGHHLRFLMRRYHVTIKQLSQETGFTMKRIREVRSSGLKDRHAIRDWIQAIIGVDPGAFV